MFRKIALRLGMDGGLYIGICIGAIAAAVLILGLLLLWSPATSTVILVTLVLILCSVLLAGFVVWLQKVRKQSPDPLCTCRYRSSLYTYCRECALKEKGTGSVGSPDLPEK
jgi:hypothetical protein